MSDLKWFCPMVAEDRGLKRASDRIYRVASMRTGQASTPDRRSEAFAKQMATPWYAKAIWGLGTERLAEFARHAAAGSGPWLDAACGDLSGSVAGWRSANNPAVGVDLSMSALERARDTVGPRPTSAFVQCDVRDLPFQTGVFDAILFGATLQSFHNPEPALIELLRTLRPGGHLYLSSLVLTERRVGNWRLGALARRWYTKPRTAEELRQILHPFGAIEDFEIDGNLAFVVLKRDDRYRRLAAADVSLSPFQRIELV